jgi:formylglycine-generating enzyme required for sulfatase activity
MKKQLSLLFFLIALCLQAQHDLPKDLLKPKVEQKQIQNVPPVTPTKQVAYLKVETNLDCELYIDAEKKAFLKAGEENMKKIALGRGEYKIVAKSIDGLDKKIMKIEMEEADKLLFIDLAAVNQARIADERRKFDEAKKAKDAHLAEEKKKALETKRAEEISKTIKEIENNMVPVPGGKFTMGCTAEQGSDCSGDEKPAHTVTLSSFYIGKYEVTQAQWESVMGSNPSNFKGCANCPVENVSWNDVQDFISKLNAKTGKKYRLPTEAEWEYAARGGSSSRGYKYAGSNEIAAVAWYDVNSNDKKTHPVGQKSPNELGIYDMSGNVREWCSDWYDVSYYSSSASTNPQGPASGSYRVLRGGSWSGFYSHCRVADRGSGSPENRGIYFGFRVLLSQ